MGTSWAKKRSKLDWGNQKDWKHGSSKENVNPKANREEQGQRKAKRAWVHCLGEEEDVRPEWIWKRRSQMSCAMAQACVLGLICSVGPWRSQISWASYFLADLLPVNRKSKHDRCSGKAQLYPVLPHAALQHLYKGFFGRIWEQTGKKLLQQADKNRMRGSSALTRLTKQILKPQTTTSNKPQSKTRAKIEELRPFTKHPLPRLPAFFSLRER